MHHHHYLKALATLGVLIMAQTFVRPQLLCAAKSIANIDHEISKREDYDANMYLLPAQQEQQLNSNVDAGEHYFVLHRHTNDDIPSVRRSAARKNHNLFNTDDDSQKILSRTDRSVDFVTLSNSLSGVKRVKNGSSGRGASVLERNERSTNLSHIAGSTRRIQLYIKNRFLQILADGTVNGTTDDTSDYTIIQRTTVNVGQIKIQAIATCLFLCMDSCGTTYGSAHFNEDCVFNESIEQHHYNTYSSTFHSNDRRKLYLGLNRHGQTRKVILPASRQLGKLSTYTNSLTHPISHDRVNAALERVFGVNHGRHSLKQLCENSKVVGDILVTGIKPKPKCDPNNVHVSGAGKPKQPGGKKKNAKISESDQINGSNKNFANGSIGTPHHKNHNTNDQSIIKLNNNKKNCQQNPHLKRCQSNGNGAPTKVDRKNMKNTGNKKNNNNQNNNSMKSSKVEKKVSAERKMPQNKIRRKKKKPPMTTIHSTTVDDDTTIKTINDYESFASDEVGSEEDDYEEGGMGISRGHISNFVNNDAYDDNI